MYLQEICRAVGLLSLAVCAATNTVHASEFDVRAKIEDVFRTGYAASDFAGLDRWYEKAVKEDQRTGSGVYSANHMVRTIRFPHARNGTPCAKPPCPSADEAFWAEQRHKAKQWVEQSPKSTLAVIVLSRTYSLPAEQYRGTWFTAKTGEENLKKFRLLNLEAVKTLTAHAEEGRKAPNWWSELLYKSFYASLGGDSYEKLVNEAIEAFPANYNIYAAVMVSRMPQWGGSLKAVEELSSRAVERTQSMEGQSLYARVYWEFSPFLPSPAFSHAGINWPRIRAGFDDIILRYPDSLNLNAFARLACIAARDKKTTARLIQRIGDDVLEQSWQSRAQFTRCKQWSQEEDEQ